MLNLIMQLLGTVLIVIATLGIILPIVAAAIFWIAGIWGKL
jgi:hypothetical protein